MNPFDTPISGGGLVLVFFALFFAAAFEFVNGFHDTANAVATVIYTKCLRPWRAVILSAVCNFIGVYLGGISVALSILKLLPVELLAAGGNGTGIAMVLALLLAAIFWNLGTWWFGLPASSSHTLIGAIIGVGVANSLRPGHTFGHGVNWSKAADVGVSLLVSPMFGLTVAGSLLLLSKKLLPHPGLHQPPSSNRPPPFWVRGLLVTTCSGVSFAHGSNDGQKGVGLVMLILMGLLPADYALNRSLSVAETREVAAAAATIERTLTEGYGDRRSIASASGAAGNSSLGAVQADAKELRELFSSVGAANAIPADKRWSVRSQILRVDGALSDLDKAPDSTLSAEQRSVLKTARTKLRRAIDYAPSWVLAMIALSLGVGTMVGWKRIVITIGEKIGKTHLTYAQGAAAELVAMSTIGVAAVAGLPVSTTHVLSSGVAGTMLAQRSGLQSSTVRNIALAWIFTLPASMLLAGVLFLGLHALMPSASDGSSTPPPPPATSVDLGVPGKDLRP